MRRKLSRSLVAAVVMLSVTRVALADLKVVTRHTYGDTSSETTTYFRGVRQREEFKSALTDPKPYNFAHIYQCDLKRFVWLDNVKRRFFDTPYVSLEEAWAEYYESLQRAKQKPTETAQHKGMWTETTTVIDTGERREVFGYVARRIKTMTVSEAAPQSCDQTRFRQETDGWYIDLLYGTECSANISGYQSVGFLVPGGHNSCVKYYEKRNYKFERRQVGTARFGFPVLLSIRAYSNDGRTFTQTKREVLSITKVDLEDALFDLPEGYARYEPKPVKRSIIERALSLFR